MSAADDPKRNDRSDMRSIVVGGETQTVTYRQAVGLISLGRAEWAEGAFADEPVKPKPRKRAAKKAVKS